MGGRHWSQIRSLGSLLCFLVLLAINIRVEAGVATVFERAVDGLVAMVVLLVSIFLALRFFGGEGEGGRRQR